MVGGAASDELISRSAYQVVMPLEELLEMSGLVLFIHGLMAVIATE